MSGMVNWRMKQIRKRNKGSQTPGKTKGPSCQTDPTKKFFASNPHAFRDPQYAQWHAEFKRMNMGGGSTSK